MKKKQAPKDQAVYKTEEQIKEEALKKIEEQRLLESLKKPQSKTGKKVENFWYHYRWLTFGCVLAVVLVGLFVKDTVFRAKPDITIIAVGTRHPGSDALDALTEMFEEYCHDINGDGKVVVSMDYIVFTPEQILSGLEGEGAGNPGESGEGFEGELNQVADTSQDYASTMKLVTVLAANIDPVYLLDEANFNYILTMGVGEDDEEGEEPDISEIFVPLNGVPGADGSALPFEQTALAEDEGLVAAYSGMKFYLRNGPANKEAMRQECLEVLRAIAG